MINYYSALEILGLRGFAQIQNLVLAIPNNELGSGLTIIVGPNSAGKSTIYEAFRAISSREPSSFPQGKRNIIADSRIMIRLTKQQGQTIILKTVKTGGSETEFLENGLSSGDLKIFTLPSRRLFSPFFSKTKRSREEYLRYSLTFPAKRGSQLDEFNSRIFTIQNNQIEFNKILSRILSPLPEWYIENSDHGEFYLRFNFGEHHHNSDGMGEGILSIITIVDTLYDSKPGDLIFIDEPELSLHPSLQKRLSEVIKDFARDRQILISTHSPYFVDWMAIKNGATITRVVKENNQSSIYRLGNETTNLILPFLNDSLNPHILGVDAKEVFFLDDNIILVEGLEDVVYLNRISELLNIPLSGAFYGWGVGGAHNIDRIASLLKDLGFKRVAVIVDNDKIQSIPAWQQKFPDYHFLALPTDDVRHKSEVKARGSKQGLIDQQGHEIVPEHKEKIKEIFLTINGYLN